MDYKNDERYWNINLLNKWFAISSILFLLSIMWMFLNDNDDEFKTYQKEFRKIESQVAELNLLEELDKVSAERDIYEFIGSKRFRIQIPYQCPYSANREHDFSWKVRVLAVYQYLDLNF